MQKEFEKLLDKEIEKLPSKYALFISGGIDSGLLAAKTNPRKIYSVYLPYGRRYNEFSDAVKIIKYLELDNKFEKIELPTSKSRIDKILRTAIKTIGRPIPHYNIFPFYVACEKAAKDGFKSIVVGDGPDETMCGYTRHLIMDKIYSIYDVDAFSQYGPTIDKILKEPSKQYAEIIGMEKDLVERIMYGKPLLDGMCAVDMALMRPDMDDMTDGIAKHFGIKIYRPYQDNKEFDDFQYNLPRGDKICGDFGKCLLRIIAEQYIPEDIAWRKQKIGGPLVPMNKLMDWDLPEFDKSKYLEFQEKILK